MSNLRLPVVGLCGVVLNFVFVILIMTVSMSGRFKPKVRVCAKSK